MAKVIHDSEPARSSSPLFVASVAAGYIMASSTACSGGKDSGDYPCGSEQFAPEGYDLELVANSTTLQVLGVEGTEDGISVSYVSASGQGFVADYTFHGEYFGPWK
jgi:hypothetical protein